MTNLTKATQTKHTPIRLSRTPIALLAHPPRPDRKESTQFLIQEILGPQVAQRYVFKCGEHPYYEFDAPEEEAGALEPR